MEICKVCQNCGACNDPMKGEYRGNRDKVRAYGAPPRCGVFMVDCEALIQQR